MNFEGFIKDFNPVILLTGCINPKNAPFLKRNDPNLREEDYLSSILFWAKQGFKIVFCENSGWDLNKIKSKVKQTGFKQIEYLQYESKPNEILMGKGYGEMQIISFALKNSKFIKDADVIIKVTGRYKIKNFKKILKYYRTTLHAIDIVCNLQRSMTWADSRFFIAKKYFYTHYLIALKDEISEKNRIYFEHILARAIHKAMSDGKFTIDLFVSLPIISGFYGTENKKYLNYWHKYFVKNILHKIKRWLIKKL